MKRSEPMELSGLLESVLHELGLGLRLKQWKVVERWPNIVGERIAKAATPERIENGKLLVRVQSPAWRNELTFLKKEIIAKINAAMGEEIVKDIIFR